MTANITYYGITDDFFELAFDDIEVTSASATRVTTVDLTSGYQTVLTGRNFAGNLETGVLSGTLTSMAINAPGGNPVLVIEGIDWPAQQFVNALIEILDDDIEESDGLESLLSLQPINFDASASDIGAEFRFNGITQPITILGSDNRDTLSGGDVNDFINPGTTPEFNGNVIFGSLGSDTIDLVDMGPDRWFDMTYEEFDTGVTVNLNGNAGTMSVNKAGIGTDTVRNINNVLDYGVSVYGGAANDTFNVNAGGGWTGLSGMQGNDTFNLTLDGTIRLNYAGGWDSRPFTGVTANLATGVVSNDGYEGTDTINILGGDGQFELRSTDLNDSILGSSADERFILRAGFDTLDAGDGYDILRYDRNGAENLNVDLAQGFASGDWYDTVFSHQFSNVEEVRGTRSGDDTITGSDDDQTLRAYDGNDFLQGFGGTDRLFGGNGNDTLEPGDNDDFDYVDPGAGNDEVLASTVFNGFLEIGHYDLRGETSVNVSFEMSDDFNTLDDATVSKGAFGTTTVLGATVAFEADGLFFSGSNLDDTFTANLTSDGWLGFKGGRGNDTYNLSNTDFGTFSILRLNFDKGINSSDRPDQGLDVNLETGIIANDGFGGRDVITGDYDFDVEIRATDNADMILGSDRDERFIGRGGNDTIDGAGGSDLIRFDRGDVDGGVTVNLTTGTATGSFSGIDFNYTLSNIEGVDGSYDADLLIGSAAGPEGFEGNDGDDVIFADGAAALYYGSDIAGQVYRLYQATLDRTPDATGHANWSGRIATGERSLLEVVQGFVGSPEFTATYSADLTNAEFVTLLYNNVLGRAPDAQGLARWTGDLANGASRAEVVLGFSESPQFSAETAAQANAYATNSLAGSWSDDVFRLYQATLDRAPDLQGQTNWSARLASGERTLLEVANGFVGSAEFTNVYSTDISNTEFVTLLYDNVLNRAPDDQGLARWTGELEDGASRAEVVLGFSQSPQFAAETAAPLKEWMRDLGEHDVISGDAGENTVAGGQFADVFLFEAGEIGSTTVLDYEAWDYLVLPNFGYGDLAQVKSHMTQSGADVIFNDLGVEVILKDTALADITEDSFLDTFFVD